MTFTAKDVIETVRILTAAVERQKHELDECADEIELLSIKLHRQERELAQRNETIAEHHVRWQADIKRLTERAEAAEAKLLEIAKLTGYIE